MHTCQARRGLAHCECRAGFLLAADRRSCEGKVPLPVPCPTLGTALGVLGPKGGDGEGTRTRSPSLILAEVSRRSRVVFLSSSCISLVVRGCHGNRRPQEERKGHLCSPGAISKANFWMFLPVVSMHT